MRISIITVCLNSERTIEQTIQSVIEQNDEDVEYIIIDGQSTDRTLEIVNKYANDISVLISESDDGIYDAMNKGIALATGDVIGIINSDDWYEPNTFALVRKCFQNFDAEVIYGNLNMVNQDGMVKTWIPSEIDKKIRYEMATPHPTVFVKKAIYEKYGVFQLKYKIASDYDLILRLYTKGVRFVYVDKILANFRLGGVSEKQQIKCMEETLSISRSFLPYVSLSEREYLKKFLLHRYKAFYFGKMLEGFSYNLPNILNTKLGVGLEDDIVIFGAGAWGQKAYSELLRRGMHPLLIVDNDKQKWGKSENGIQILSPEVLESYRGVLLVMVKNSIAEILQQVEAMCNNELYCITWEEIIDEFINSKTTISNTNE